MMTGTLLELGRATGRHMRHHWRVNLAVLVCFSLASALLASLGIHSSAVEETELRRSLVEARPAERTLLITGSRFAFSEPLYQELQSRLGTALAERTVIRRSTIPARALPGAGHQAAVSTLDVYAFDTLLANVTMLEGTWPAHASMSDATGYWPPPIQAVLGKEVADGTGLGIGDRLTSRDMYHRLDIVGIVEPLDAGADLWGEDLRAFTPVSGTLPVIIGTNSMRSYLGKPVFDYEVAWRLTLDPSLVRVRAVEKLAANIINFQTQSATKQVEVNTGLLDVLAAFQARLTGLRLVKLYLTLQNLAFVLITLSGLALVVPGRFRFERLILSARGASTWQMVHIPVWGFLCTALVAGLILGPGLALGSVALWGPRGGILTSWLPREAWLWSGVAVGVGWLFISLALYLAARRGTQDRGQAWERPALQPLIHRRFLDVFMLALGGLLYWQLNRAGSATTRGVSGGPLGGSQLADPLLLLGPFLVALGALLVGLRLVPPLLGLAARAFQALRRLVLPVGLGRLAYDPFRSEYLVLVASLTSGLVFFALCLGGLVPQNGATARPHHVALAAATARALRLNAMLLVALGVATFVLGLLPGIRDQDDDVNLIRRLGVSRWQRSSLWGVEGAVVALIGLLVGVAFGAALASLLVPFVMP